jgi:hypothetical protein
MIGFQMKKTHYVEKLTQIAAGQGFAYGFVSDF